MADFSSRLVSSDSTENSREELLTVESSRYLLGDCGMTEEGESSSVSLENGNWDHFGMDHITTVRIDDNHILDVQSDWDQELEGWKSDIDCLEVAYVLPSEIEGSPFMGAEMTAGESLKDDEEQGVYVIEYNNPETEGESYQFKLAVDGQFSAKEETKPLFTREHLRRPLAKKLIRDEAIELRRRPKTTKGGAFFHSQSSQNGETLPSETSQQETGSKRKTVVCSLCPQPGKVFKNMAGLSVHLKQLHYNGVGKTFFCKMCQKHCRNQLALDDHIRHHASKEAVFQCPLCPFKAPGKIRKRGVKGRFGIKVHLETEHPGVIPECNVCSKHFRNLDSYLKDQVRHIGVTPFYCPQCQIYEMTERGLLVHMRNHNKKQIRQEEAAQPQGGEEDTTTDDSDS